MIRQCLVCFLFIFLLQGSIVFAQDQDLRSNVDYKINKMTKVLHLTDRQAYAIRPIVKEYLTKRAAVLEGIAGEGIIDHVAVKSTLKGLKEDEYQKLSKILSEDQLKKWIDRDNLMAALNPDSIESPVDEGVGLTATGANFKF
jgi:hypothetical protein